MPNNASYVGVGKPKVGGAVFIAPIGTAAPSDASTELDGGFELLGYISEDGVTITEERDSENIVAWGGDTVYTSQTSYTETFTFTPIEVNPVVARAEYGDDNVEVSGGLMTIKHSSAEAEEKMIVIETVPNSGTLDRFFIPRAKLTEKGDQALTDSDPMGRECTFTALPDDSGVTAYEFISNEAFGTTGTTGETGAGA